jgi:hypothetical protein
MSMVRKVARAIKYGAKKVGKGAHEAAEEFGLMEKHIGKGKGAKPKSRLTKRGIGVATAAAGYGGYKMLKSKDQNYK